MEWLFASGGTSDSGMAPTDYGCNGFNGHNGCWTAKRGETAPVLMEAVSVDDIVTSDGFLCVCGFE